MLIYVYYTSSLYPSSQATIARTEIAVRQKQQPHDYYYVENITTVTAEMIKQEVLDEVTADFTVRFEGMEDAVVERVSADITSANERMDEIEQSFADTTAAVTEVATKASEDVANLQAQVAAMQEQADKESEVFYVEENTLHAENVNVKGNLIIGNWIWFDNEDGSLSLKWVGGDA